MAVWIAFAVAAVLIAVATARVFPGAIEALLTWIMRLRYTIFAIVGGLTALYFLSSGSLLYVFIGMVGIVVAVWQVLFNNPFGWLPGV
jgi:hypothetical protein